MMKTQFLVTVFCLMLAYPMFAQQGDNPSGQKGFVCGDEIKDTRDGKAYKTVQIGTQCWMSENLNIGTRIKGTKEQTNNATVEKYCYNDLEENCNVYGGLYQWNEMMKYSEAPKSPGLCPTGWHVPADDEWDALIAYLEGDVNAGRKMKEQGDSHFMLPNFGANNKSGFTALPGGYSYATGSNFYANLQKSGYFWSSSSENTTDAYVRMLGYANERIWRYLSYKSTGSSVRCIAD